MDQELAEALRDEDLLKAARIFLRQGQTALAYEYGVNAFVKDGGHRECLGNNPKCEGRVTCTDEGDTTFYRICVPETAKAAHSFLELVRNSWDRKRFRRNPDSEEQALLRKIKEGDEDAILRLAHLWFRTGQGAAQKIEPQVFQISLAPTHPASDPRDSDGTLTLKILNQHEIVVEGTIYSWDRTVGLNISAQYTDYDDGVWTPYVPKGDKLEKRFLAMSSEHLVSRSDIDAANRLINTCEHDIITPAIRNWAEENQQALLNGNKYHLYVSVQEAFKELERTAVHYRAAQNHLSYEMKQFLEKSKDFKRNPDLQIKEMLRQLNTKPDCGLWRKFLAATERAGYNVQVTAQFSPNAANPPPSFIGILEGVDDGEYGCQLILRTGPEGGGTVFANEVVNIEMFPKPILNRRRNY